MNAGKLRHVIRLERKEELRAPDGQPSCKWVCFKRVRGGTRNVHFKGQTVDSDRPFHVVEKFIRVRHAPFYDQIQPGDRAVIERKGRDEVTEIIGWDNVGDGRANWIDIKVKMLGGKGHQTEGLTEY